MIRNLCTKGMLLENGNLVFQGDVEDTLSKYLHKNKAAYNHDLTKRTDRSGKGNYLFEKIEFKTANKESEILKSGDEISIISTIKILNHYKTNLECAFAIIDENGNHVTDLGNYYTNEKLNSTNKDKLEIWCRLDELSLNAGKYSINCWLCTGRGLEDYIINVGIFEIAFGDYFETGRSVPQNKGCVLMKQKWNIY